MLIALLGCVYAESLLQSLLGGARYSEMKNLPAEPTIERESIALGVSPSGEWAVMAVQDRIYLASSKLSSVVKSVRVAGPRSNTQWVRFSHDGSRFAVGDGYEQRVYSTGGLKLLHARQRVGYAFWQGKSLVGVRLDEDGGPKSWITLFGPAARPAFPKAVWPVFGTGDGRTFLCVRNGASLKQSPRNELSAYEVLGALVQRRSAWIPCSDRYPFVGSFVTKQDRFGRYVIGQGGVATNKTLAHPHIVSSERLLSPTVGRSLGLSASQFPFWQPGFVMRNGCIGGFVRIATAGQATGKTVENTVFVSLGASDLFWKEVPMEVYAVEQSKQDTWIVFKNGSRLTLARTWE